MSIVSDSPGTLGAGIDYVTCTATRPVLAAALLALGQDLIEHEVGSGGVVKPWYWQGFSGRSAGSVQVGFTGRRSIVRASGAAARECAKDVIGLSDNVSRLDIQLTVRSDDLGTDYAKRLFESDDRTGARRGKPLARALVQTSAGGDTFYLGKRISDSFGRVYNKSAEDKVREDPPRWRYEVEYKRRQALAAARSYQAAADKDSWCVGEVAQWFERRHCPPPVSSIDRVDMRGSARGSASQANRIDWLRRGVRPVIQQLIAEFGVVDVLALLGIGCEHHAAHETARYWPIGE